MVGFLVGLTGAGGGALMTPMLILLFGIKPSTAISSDLVAAVVMRPFGAAVHLKKDGQLPAGGMDGASGSVPMAFLGAYLLHLLGNAKARRQTIENILGSALLVGAAAMVLRYSWIDGGQGTRGRCVHGLTIRPLPTVVIGMVGGLIVGMTSVGFRLADDRAAAVPLPDPRSQPVGRHRSDPGRSAHPGRRTRRPGLRPR